MTRKIFLTIAGCIALAVGAFALLLPGALLASKGVAPDATTQVWVREVGVALVAIGVMSVLLRSQPASPAVRAFLIGSAVLQLGLLPIEIVAAASGVITLPAGVIPNSVVHVLLAIGFGYYAVALRVPAPAADAASGTSVAVGLPH